MTEKKYDMFEEELDAIRLRLYEEVKDMTPEEWIAYSIARAEPIMKEFNMKWASLRPVRPMKRERLPL